MRANCIFASPHPRPRSIALLLAAFCLFTDTIAMPMVQGPRDLERPTFSRLRDGPILLPPQASSALAFENSRPWPLMNDLSLSRRPGSLDMDDEATVPLADVRTAINFAVAEVAPSNRHASEAMTTTEISKKAPSTQATPPESRMRTTEVARFESPSTVLPWQRDFRLIQTAPPPPRILPVGLMVQRQQPIVVTQQQPPSVIPIETAPRLLLPGQLIEPPPRPLIDLPQPLISAPIAQSPPFGLGLMPMPMMPMQPGLPTIRSRVEMPAHMSPSFGFALGPGQVPPPPPAQLGQPNIMPLGAGLAQVPPSDQPLG
ncbi:unnamed protein product [Protopolystoma xenopodis]|uniref:Uncharacterized protein n=1 Tax=Protopolystoma xenopodis TaxID=117903 RepID=A0A3S5CQY4_9PLAT|nr:unnamed protein product [Protopolystoma xenopodis]